MASAEAKRRRKIKNAEAAKRRAAESSAAAPADESPAEESVPEKPVDAKPGERSEATWLGNPITRLFARLSSKQAEKVDDDEDDDCEGLSYDAYAAAIAEYNKTSASAAEQFDKTILAIATVALGFSIKIFTEAKDAEPWVVKTALFAMIAFSASVLISLASFQFTIASVRRGIRALERLWHGKKANPNERDWVDKSIDWLNGGSFLSLFIGIVSMVCFGYWKVDEAVTNNARGSTATSKSQETLMDENANKEVFREGTQRPFVALPKKTAQAMPIPETAPVEAPKPKPTATPTPPAQP